MGMKISFRGVELRPRERWSIQDNTYLMRYMLRGRKLSRFSFGGSLFVMSLDIHGRDRRACKSQLGKIAVGYTEDGRRAPQLVEMRRCRRGDPFDGGDWWVIRKAFGKRGRVEGSSTIQHVARCTGRTVEEIRRELERVFRVRKGFDLSSFEQRVYSFAKDRGTLMI